MAQSPKIQFGEHFYFPFFICILYFKKINKRRKEEEIFSFYQNHASRSFFKNPKTKIMHKVFQIKSKKKIIPFLHLDRYAIILDDSLLITLR